MQVITIETIKFLFPLIKNIGNIKLKRLCIALIKSPLIVSDESISEYKLDPIYSSFDFSSFDIQSYENCLLCWEKRDDIDSYVYLPSLDFTETSSDMCLRSPKSTERMTVCRERDLRLYDYNDPTNYFPVCNNCIYTSNMLSSKLKKFIKCYYEKTHLKSRRRSSVLVSTNIISPLNFSNISEFVLYCRNLCTNRELFTLVVS